MSFSKVLGLAAVAIGTGVAVVVGEKLATAGIDGAPGAAKAIGGQAVKAGRLLSSTFSAVGDALDAGYVAARASVAYGPDVVPQSRQLGR